MIALLHTFERKFYLIDQTDARNRHLLNGESIRILRILFADLYRQISSGIDGDFEEAIPGV